jgi:hypothetical protein
MQADLDKERKTITRNWAKREEQIRGRIESTAIYGDLKGIAGRNLQEVEGLDMPLLGGQARHGGKNCSCSAGMCLINAVVSMSRFNTI